MEKSFCDAELSNTLRTLGGDPAMRFFDWKKSNIRIAWHHGSVFTFIWCDTEFPEDFTWDIFLDFSWYWIFRKFDDDNIMWVVAHGMNKNPKTHKDRGQINPGFSPKITAFMIKFIHANEYEVEFSAERGSWKGIFIISF